MDQVYALNCMVSSLNPLLRPVHNQEVGLGLLFLSFSSIFPFDSLGAVPENPCTDIRGVWFAVCPVYRGTTVTVSNGHWNGRYDGLFDHIVAAMEAGVTSQS